MQASVSVLSLAFQLVCLAGLAAQMFLAGRAVQVERRSGLLPSYKRVGLLFLLSGLLVTLLWVELRTPAAAPVIPPQPVPLAAGPISAPPERLVIDNPAQAETRKKLEAARGELAQLERRAGELRRQIDQLQKELGLPAALPSLPPAPAPKQTPAPPAEHERTGEWMTPLAVALLLLGLLLLVTTGETSTLWPAIVQRLRTQIRGNKARKEAQQRCWAELTGLIEAARQQNFEQGMVHADKIRQEQLSPLEVLDYLFLRAYCAVGQILAAKDQGIGDAQRQLLRTAVADLTALQEQAPNLHEAEYLLSLAHTLLGEYERAQTYWNQVELNLAAAGLPIAHNKSVCLLILAEQKLEKGDPAAANPLFDEVTRLAVLTARIPGLLLNNRLEHVRDSLRRGQLDEVQKAVELVRQLEGLSASQQLAAAVTCDVFEVVSLFQASKLPEMLARTQRLLAERGPSQLPELDEHTADEYLFPAVESKDLPMPAEFFRALYYLQAVAMAQVAARTKQEDFTEAQVTALREPLLRALQFEPRHREVLAALGGLYFFFLPAKRLQALAWLESAVVMGVASPTVRRILEQARHIEVERRDLLQRFLSASGRFLGDPQVSAQLRKALREELGRFQEFQPLLIELDQDTVRESSPTLDSLRCRAQYVEALLAAVVTRSEPARSSGLAALKQSYVQLIKTVERSATDLQDLEGQVMAAVGKSVLY